MNSEKLFALAKAKGLDDLQIVADTAEALNLVYYEGTVERNETSSISDLTVSAVLRGQKAVFAVEDLTMPEEDVIDALFDIASHLEAEPTEIFAGSPSYPAVSCEPSDFHQIPLRAKIDLLADIEQKIRAREPRVVQIPEIEYEESAVSRRIENSKGLAIEKRSETVAVAFELVASDGKDSKIGFKYEVKKNFAEIDVDKMIDAAIEEAVGMFGASPVESGNYPVVVENEAMISLLRSFSGMFSGEAHLKKISPIQGKLGEKVFSDKISFIDAPLLPDAVKREPFDDEGVACYDKTVVDKGIFKTMLHNLKTAKAFGTESTGNAFRGGASPANGYIVPGTASKDELIASMEKGLLITGFDGLHAGLNAISGDLSLKTYGYLVEGGRITRPVTLIILSGNFLTMMNGVAEVGSDLVFKGGLGCPSIKFEEVSISG